MPCHLALLDPSRSCEYAQRGEGGRTQGGGSGKETRGARTKREPYCADGVEKCGTRGHGARVRNACVRACVRHITSTTRIGQPGLDNQDRTKRQRRSVCPLSPRPSPLIRHPLCLARGLAPSFWACAPRQRQCPRVPPTRRLCPKTVTHPAGKRKGATRSPTHRP